MSTTATQAMAAASWLQSLLSTHTPIRIRRTGGGYVVGYLRGIGALGKTCTVHWTDEGGRWWKVMPVAQVLEDNPPPRGIQDPLPTTTHPDAI